MIYKCTKDLVDDLDRNGHVVRLSVEVDPDLEMAEIQRRVYAAGGPAVFFEKVKGSDFPAVSNLFGTLNRARFIFRKTLRRMQKLIELHADPSNFLKKSIPVSRRHASHPLVHATEKSFIRPCFSTYHCYRKTAPDQMLA